MTIRSAHLRIVLAPGEGRPHVPAHLDCILGATRPANHLDGGGALDRALGGRGHFRAQSVFHARRSTLRIGQQAAGYTDVEEALGLSRSYLVEVAAPATVGQIVDRLRSLAVVESAGPELLARSYRVPKVVASRRPAPTFEEAALPFRMIEAFEAARREPGREDLLIGVVDTGVALGHPELRGRLVQGFDFVDLGIGLAGGPELLGDSSGRDDLPEDEVGHGTHVAGVIGAAGKRLPSGLAGRCRALPVRVLAGALGPRDTRPFGIGSLSDIDAGIKFAIDRGAAVVNLSLGTPAAELLPGAPLPHSEVCAYAESREVILVAASGNDGSEVPYYPAALPTVLAVGSVGSDGRVSDFTSGGSHVRLHAPGEDIVGLSLRGYRRSTGTSHAAPFVSAAAALVAARARGRGDLIPAQTVRRLLENSARPRAPGGPPVLDAAAALAAVDRVLREPDPATPSAVDVDRAPSGVATSKVPHDIDIRTLVD